MNAWKIGMAAFFVCLTLGCQRPHPELVTRVGEPDAVKVKGEDARLDEARRQARASLDQFTEALKAPHKTQTRFSLKAEFVEGKVHEYMWLKDVRPEGFDFTGTLANTPVQLKKLHHGQRVRVKSVAVTDWMFVDGGGLVGGYTIRTLADGLTTNERQRLEKEGGFTL
jgi:uncharacterized protein YegJ (DUF2314 family)